MKTLFLLRHAKSDWEADYSTDHQRPLSKRGRKAAAAMGRYLFETDQLPDQVISSDAKRTRETLKRAQKAGGWEGIPVHYSNDLYLSAGPEVVLGVLRKAPEHAAQIMLVGHEPTWSETVSALIGGGEIRFPTGALARLTLEVDYWRNVDPGCGELILMLPPRLLAS